MDTANLLFDTVIQLAEIWIFVPAGMGVIAFAMLAYYEWVWWSKK